MQSKEHPSFVETTSNSSVSQSTKARPKKLAGKTLDLTLFAATRALDVLVGELWSQRRTRRMAQQKWTKVYIHITHRIHHLGTLG